MASMLTHSTVQPQVVAALSQLSSLFSGVRTLHTSVRARHQKKEREISSACAVSPVSKPPAFPSSEVKGVPSTVDLTDLPRDVDSGVLSPLLAIVKQQDASHSHWQESHVSAQTFFENKTGFPEGHLQSTVPTFLQIMGDKGFQSFLGGAFTPCVQQTRGFKTKRSQSGSGLGRDKKMSFLDELRHSVQSKLFPDAYKKEMGKFQNIVKAHESNPEFQDRLKVAFAEGYHANSKQESPDTKNSMLNRTLRFLFYMCMLWLLVQVVQVFTAVGGTGVRGLGVLTKDQFEVNPEEVNVTFDDVKGADEAKTELMDVVDYLKDPEKYQSLGAKLPKGVLLVGQPGIGKTLLARAVAGEAGVPFYHASGSEFDEIFVGTGAKRIRQLFSAAKMRAPCVIFLDEIDSVGASRTNSQIHPYANQTINQLLAEMDGFNQNEGVIVLGATNRRNNLDSALLRPGRFDVEVTVYPPSLKGRKEILEYYIGKVKADSKMDFDLLAQKTVGFTGADLQNMVNQAALQAAREGAVAINMDHMDYARDKVVMGPAKKSLVQDDTAKWKTAFHEAGHTLVAHFTKDAPIPNKVTILPRGSSLGHTAMSYEKELFNMSRAQLLARMDVSMGGRAAEEVIYGMDKVETGAKDDFSQATTIASAMVKEYGMSEKVGTRVFKDNNVVTDGVSKMNNLSPAIQEQIDGEIKRLLQESYDRAKLLLHKHQAEHKALAQALIKLETLDKDQIKAVIEGKQVGNQS
ncbi:ATP-dependent zinc metalloprotease YME1L-like isoform X2 [Haliotis rubra]|uniref:ATP-dependent zinc metalloprotease YME1L-like isoform X2 n=1 Tax=Haliotis rubra TaxID=36100 RepID=UPI001EE608E3|nr:ATP-dependent zinc metalloprotease YME1L-like isoform X2 [Haliotis rubra]